jgi:hypothetical protein
VHACTAQRVHQRGVIQLADGLQQRRGPGQRGAQFAHVPAFDDREAIADHATTAHVLQQRARRHARLQRIFADLDAGIGTKLARQRLPFQVMAVAHAGFAQPRQHAPEGIAGLDPQRLASLDP